MMYRTEFGTESNYGLHYKRTNDGEHWPWFDHTLKPLESNGKTICYLCKIDSTCGYHIDPSEVNDLTVVHRILLESSKSFHASAPNNYVTIEPITVRSSDMTIQDEGLGIFKVTPSNTNTSLESVFSDLNASLHAHGFNASNYLVVSKYDSSRLSYFVLVTNVGTQVSHLATVHLNTDTAVSNIIGFLPDDVVINDMTVRVVTKVC